MPEEISSPAESSAGHQVVVSDQHGVGQTSKSAVELVKVFTDWLVTPRAILAKSKAEAEALKITSRAKTEAEIERFKMIDAKRTELEERALLRRAEQDIQSQANLEEVIQGAIPLLKDNAEPDKIDADWRTAFARHASDVSDSEVSSLWSKILAGEANQPGAFSKRTLALMADISKTEAELFEMICRFKTSTGLIIYDYEAPIYAENGLTFAAILILMETGLIDTMDNITEYARTGLAKVFLVGYHTHALLIPNPPKLFAIGKVTLTAAGEQMAKVCNPQPVPGFADYLLKRWYHLGAFQHLNQIPGAPPMCRKLNPNGEVEIVPVPNLNAPPAT